MNREIAARQINRLSALPYWSTITDPGRVELVDALTACCDDEQHAKAVIDEWLSDQRELPAPADLRALARTTKTEKPLVYGNCARCGTTGFEHVDREDGYSFARPCRLCDRGRALLAAKQQRVEAAPVRGKGAR